MRKLAPSPPSSSESAGAPEASCRLPTVSSEPVVQVATAVLALNRSRKQSVSLPGSLRPATGDPRVPVVADARASP